MESKIEGNAIGIENPFTLKVGQVFTGFGIGCGVGIGVGRPLNLGAIPMLNQVMSATRGATDAFSGVSRHVNTSLRKLGAKNIEVGVGCGIGFGHGFGAGLAVKPGVLNQIQSCLVVTMTKMMMKFGLTPSLPFSPGAFPASLQSATSTAIPGSMTQLASKSTDQLSQGLAGSQPMNIGSDFDKTALKDTAADTTYGTRTEKVLNNFLQNPLLKGEGGGGSSEAAGRLQTENKILQMVTMTKMMMKFGLTPSLPFSPGAFPASLQSATSTAIPGSMTQLASKSTDQLSQGLAGSQPMNIGSDFDKTALKDTAADTTYGTRTEKVLNNFLQNPLLKGEGGGGSSEAAGRLQTENKILQMVLKHQQIIEELVEENEKLRQILVEELKVPTSKLEASSSGRIRNKLPCTDCFECRRKQRRRSVFKRKE